MRILKRTLKCIGDHIHEVVRFQFSIMDVDFLECLEEPLRIKLKRLKPVSDWRKSKLEFGSFRTNVEGYLHTDGNFEIPKGTKVERVLDLCIQYKLKVSSRCDVY